MSVRRLYVEKRQGFDIEARNLYQELTRNLGITRLENVRILHRYDTEDIPEKDYTQAKNIIFSEPPVDDIYEEEFPMELDDKAFVVSLLPGQFDQRADSAAQCLQLISLGEQPNIHAAKVIVLKGSLQEKDVETIKEHVINRVEAHEIPFDKQISLKTEYAIPADVASVYGFGTWTDESLHNYLQEMSFAMSFEDLKYCSGYFRQEKRDPSVTELRMIDTYWSDHCRHTTFLTEIDHVTFEKGSISEVIQKIWEQYLETRESVYSGKNKTICLMDIAVIGMKALKKSGKLDNLDESEEINACSIVVEAEVEGRMEEWLVMFKNETHNHPTEIEPFGGAATCLGGAIRDPLSGRSYVYQAMRVTGCGDPTAPVHSTLPGKLPQRVISTTAAAGYSSYGNQIGLATGKVEEIYHPGYIAKRMEIGAVTGAVPKNQVIRSCPAPDDIIILLGGRTGRDGCGGATGSSKEHTEESLFSCSAEVQKGNPPTERKIQRLFRNPDVSRIIKRCNDFGAGGVSVAIGELADGLDINLDAIPKKYEGLDGTELAISESQERMAVVVSPEHAGRFIEAAKAENLEAVKVAIVTGDNRLRMRWRGKRIVDISRDFLNTNGISQHIAITISEPDKNQSPFSSIPSILDAGENDIAAIWLENLKRLNVCSQKGLVERFDSTIGSGTIQMPFGGKYQYTPSESAISRLPVLSGKTTTGTAMSFGFNPDISSWSPFHGAVFAVVESVAKLIASGAELKDIRLTLQEYFEKLGNDTKKWGKPLAALLGAFTAQMSLGIAAIGGKDSMSGTFKDLNVPPTLVSFAIAPMNVTKSISAELKRLGSKVVFMPASRDENDLPIWDRLIKGYGMVHQAIRDKKIISASTVKFGGIAGTLSTMAFGNKIGVNVEGSFTRTRLFCLEPGALILELSADAHLEELFPDMDVLLLGTTIEDEVIRYGDIILKADTLIEGWLGKLESVFPTKVKDNSQSSPEINGMGKTVVARKLSAMTRPRVFIPVFPGTNCEYDTSRAFAEAGAVTDVCIMNNLTARDVDQSVHEMEKRIRNSQMIAIPGGFSAGDEPEGSGKFIATVFRNPYLADAIMDLLQNRDGLVLGICNGFQALVKLGLLPYGDIRSLTPHCPTLTFNRIGRHVSTIVQTKNTSKLSPWMLKENLGAVKNVPVSHGEGRFVADLEVLKNLAEKGQIASQYVDLTGNPSQDIRYNPNGSEWAIEGLTSADGRVFGKMGHSERYTEGAYKNVPGEYRSQIFESGVYYYR